jgi:hypothetical protein
MNPLQTNQTIVERQTDGTGVDVAGAAGATVMVLNNIPCGFAHHLRLMLTVPAAGIQRVIVRMYGRNKTISVTTNVSGGGPLAAGSYGYVFPATAAIGQSCAVLVVLDAGGAPVGSMVQMWVEALG